MKYASSPTILAAFVVILLLNGCSSMDRIRPQALQPDDQNLPKLEHNLVLLSVDIDQTDTRLKLHRMVARNLETQQLWVFPFFDNTILGSSQLPFREVGNTTEHLVFVDIPAGTYQLTKTDFKYFQYNILGSNTAQHLEHELYTPVYFKVPNDDASYLGNLIIKIVTPRVQSEDGDVYSQLVNDQSLRQTFPTMTNAALNAAKTTIQTLGGYVYFDTPGARREDIQKASKLYPVLVGTQFGNGRIWIE